MELLSVLSIKALEGGGGGGDARWGSIKGTLTDQNDLVDYVAEEIDKLSGKVMKFKGYISLVEPTDKRDGILWYESEVLPVAFPIQVKEYSENAWVSKSYTPAMLDLWSFSDGNGYYYFGSKWNRLDEQFEEDNITIEVDNGVLQFAKKTSADKYKVWKLKPNGTWGLSHINEWKIVDKFDGEKLNDYTLYILIKQTTYDGETYKKGFYTYDTTDGLVLRSSETEIDEETIVLNNDGELEARAIINIGSNALPTTNIKKSIYLQSQVVSWVDEEEHSHSFTMLKNFIYQNNAWVGISRIELTEEQYSHLTQAQKEDGTIYVVEGTPVSDLSYKTLPDKPTINGIVVMGNLTLADLSLYSRLEIDSLLANKGTAEFVDELPITKQPLTWYYSKKFADDTPVPNDKRALYITDKDNVLYYMGIVGDIDLSEYYTKAQADAKFNDKLIDDGSYSTPTDTDTVANIDVATNKVKTITFANIFVYILSKISGICEKGIQVASGKLGHTNSITAPSSSARFILGVLDTEGHFKGTPTAFNYSDVFSSTLDNCLFTRNGAKGLYDYVNGRKKYLHSFIRYNSDAKEYTMGWINIISEESSMTFDDLKEWLKDGGYTSVTNPYFWCGGCCGTTGVRNQQDTGTAYIGRVVSGVYINNEDNVYFKYDYNGTVQINETRVVVVSTPLMV